MRTRNWNKYVAMGLMVTGVVSCGSGAPPARPTAGGAIIDADAGKVHRNRIRGSKIVSINGVRNAGDEVEIASGLTSVTVYYKWPQGGAQQVNLKFQARKDRRYFVKYSAFPPNVDKLSGTTALETTAEGFGAASFGMMESSMRNPNPAAQVVGSALGLVALTPGVILGTVDFWSRVAADVADKRKPAQWVDMMVISEKEAEGVVRFVRVYPSGKVEWKPWDAASNAPGNAQSGQVVGRRPVGIAGNQENGTFRRQESFAE